MQNSLNTHRAREIRLFLRRLSGIYDFFWKRVDLLLWISYIPAIRKLLCRTG